MKNRSIKRVLIIILIVAAAAVFAGVILSRKPAEVPDEEAKSMNRNSRPTAVRVVMPRVEDMETIVSYVGTVFSQKEVKIIARVPGTVVELPVREGESAGKDALLARIDAPEIRAQVERLTVDRNYWSRRHEADKRLVEKNALAAEQADAGERSLKTTEAALSEAASQLGKTRESAPFAGTVLSWFVEPGQSVLPGQPILLFGSHEAEIRVEVAEEDLRRGVKPGTLTEVEFEPGVKIRTQVSEVSPAAGGRSRTFTVRVPLPSDIVRRPRVGSSLRLNFILQSQPGVLTVPINAVVDKLSSPHIFLVHDGRAVRVPVKPGVESRGRIAVDFPWNTTDKVVVSNLSGLTDSTPVFPVDAEEAAE